MLFFAATTTVLNSECVIQIMGKMKEDTKLRYNDQLENFQVKKKVIMS